MTDRYINTGNIHITADTMADDMGEIYVSLTDVRKSIDQTPTADVVPRAEYESMANTVNEASDLIRSLKSRIRRLETYDEQRDIALHARLIDETRAETAREIFAEIEHYAILPFFDEMHAGDVFIEKEQFAELKKKYTEGENEKADNEDKA